MASARKKPTLEERLAACLIIMGYMDREHAKLLTPCQIVSVVEWDHHPVPHALGGTNHPTNLQPLGRLTHREKSKSDTSRIAKGKRLSRAEEIFRARLLAKTQPDTPPPERKKYQWAKGRKIQSRGFKR